MSVVLFIIFREPCYPICLSWW